MGRDKALLEAFAAELKAKRHALKLSQEELAHRAGINRTYIAKLELAKNHPTLGVLQSLAVGLEVELPNLLEATLTRLARSRAAIPAKQLPKGMSEADWSSLKAGARNILIAVAKSRQPQIARVDLRKRLSLRDDSYLDRLVAEISEEEVQSGRCMLGAVVSATPGGSVPGCNFYDTAKMLGRNVKDPEKCWLEELDRLRQYWKNAS